MPKVIADITMSLDGYVTGPGADIEHGLGDAPELHEWVFDGDPIGAEILEGAKEASGAVGVGRRLFDTVDSEESVEAPAPEMQPAQEVAEQDPTEPALIWRRAGIAVALAIALGTALRLWLR